MILKTVKWTQRLRNLNKKITSNDEVFKIKEFVKKIDIKPLEESLSGTGRGQHVIPLWIPLAVWLFAFTQGEQRYREIAKFCKKNDDYYWLSCGFEPSGAYFSRWKKVVMPFIIDLNKSYKNYLLKNDLLCNELLAIDGVKVETWASLRQSKTEKQIEKEINKIEDKLADDETESKQKMTLDRRKNKLEQRKAELIERKEESEDKTEKEKEKMRINITSPETVTLLRYDGKVIQGVNVQTVVNQAQLNNLISVESRSNDFGLLGKMYDKLCAFFAVRILEILLLLDSGYWEKNDVRRFDPSLGYKVVMANPAEVAKSRNRKVGHPGKGGWQFKDGFRYDEEMDVVVCPDGMVLSRKSNVTIKGKYERQVFRACQGICGPCEKRKMCLGQSNQKVKTITFSQETPEEKRMKEYYHLPENKELYKKRGIMNEPVHSQMLNNRGITKIKSILWPSIEGSMHMLDLIHTMKKIEKKHGRFFPADFSNDKLLGLLFFLLWIRLNINRNFSLKIRIKSNF